MGMGERPVARTTFHRLQVNPKVRGGNDIQIVSFLLLFSFNIKKQHSSLASLKPDRTPDSPWHDVAGGGQMKEDVSFSPAGKCVW